MKTNNLFFALIILCLSITSCSVETIRVDHTTAVTTVDHTDIITTENSNYTDYTSVEIANDFNAYITFSDTEESIEIEANENLHQYIIATKNGNTLLVKLKNNINVKGPATLNVYIKTKSITNFKAAADSNIYLENALEADDVKISLAADSYMSGELNVDNLEYSGAADTRAELYGFINNLDARLTADSRLSDYDLEVNNLKIKLAADSKAYLTVSNTIDVDAVADSALYYKGEATIVHQVLKADSKVVKVD